VRIALRALVIDSSSSAIRILALVILVRLFLGCLI
jgi:hypothetical protein